MPARYDVVIVGGGHNGLVTAAYQARAGRKVLVLERREMLGGCAVTEEIWPGYRVSTAAYVISLFQTPILRELPKRYWITRHPVAIRCRATLLPQAAPFQASGVATWRCPRTAFITSEWIRMLPQL